MPDTDAPTPPGDRAPVPASARTPAKPARRPATLTLAQRLARRGDARQAHEHAREDGIARAKSARSQQRLAHAGATTIGGPVHMAMPASVPIVEPDHAQEAGSLFAELNFDDGVTLIGRPADTPAPSSSSRMHSIVETMSHAVMVPLYRNGWCPIPQQYLGGKRGPEDGIEYSKFKDHCPTLPMIEQWSAKFPSSNVALLMGAPSHYTFALDLDVHRDHPLYDQIMPVIFEHLGNNLMMRFGAKGVVIILRSAPDVVVRNITLRFAQAGGEEASPGMIEVLGHGSLVTAYGHHHKTGDYFKWSGLMPIYCSPLRARLTTPEELQALLRAIGQVRAYAGKRTGGSRGCPQDPDAIMAYDHMPEVPGAFMPRFDLADERWSSDGERIVDGRRRFLLVHSLALVAGNGHLILGDESDKRWRGIIAPALAAVLAAVRTDGKRDSGQIKAQYLKLVETTVDRLRTRHLQPWTLHAAPDGGRVKAGRLLPPTAEDAVHDAALAWLGKPALPSIATLRGGAAPAAIRITHTIAATAATRQARNLDVDRALERARIAAGTDAALDDFIVSALAKESKIHLLDTATGGGKTTRTVVKVLPALTQDEDEDGKPVLFVMPTLANLAEAAEVARAQGFCFETGDAEQELAAMFERRLEALGIPAVTWKSKASAGCRMQAVAEMLNTAGIGTGNLCRALSSQRGEDGERKFVDCDHMEPCLRDGYQAMKAKAKKAKVILLSHYWLTAPVLPEELQECKAVIIDESILFRVASTGWLPRSAFDLQRPIPSMTKLDRIEMKAKGGSRMPESAVHDRWVAEATGSREYAARIAQRGVDERWDLTRLASEFAKDPRSVDAVRMQVRILRDAMSHGSRVRPNIGTAEIARLVEQAKPRFLALERRFWVTVLELVTQIRADTDPKRKADAPMVARRNADGSLRRDTRLQAIQQAGTLGVPEWGYRVSWRATLNWSTAPTLMLDASADEDVVKRLYPGREVVHHHVAPGVLNLRTVLIADATYSGSSLDPRPQGDEGDEARALTAAEKKVGIRKLLELASTSHGHGRVLFGASKAVRDLIMRTWTHPPANIDEVHYGAQRGLDFAKNHLCAVSVGRTEMPIWLVDGLAAALTWDMDEPEEPYDRRGDGLQDDGKPLMRKGVTRMVQRRDGSDVGLSVPMVLGTYGRKIDAQWRDEELNQFRGRLRPVYRDDPATWICVSSVFPEGVIADAILTLDEAISTWSPVMSAQAIPGVDGVVAVGVTDRIPGIGTAQVEQFLAEHADDPAYRDVTYSTQNGEIILGLVSAFRDPDTPLPSPTEEVHVSVGPPKTALLPSKARELDATTLARPSAEERARRAAAWTAWYRERAAAGDETVTRHSLPIAVMLRHRDDPPGYVPPTPETDAVPEIAPAIADAENADDYALWADIFPGAEIVAVRSLVAAE